LAGDEHNGAATVTIVTGLPRSGTSMMMQMLAAGGCRILTDGARAADANNPHGYLEYELVKRLPIESGWLHLARGKALKVVAPLLPWLPLEAADGSPFHYRVVFMNRDPQEIADSQLRMLRDLGRERMNQPGPLLQRAMQQDLGAARDWLSRYAVPGIDVDYRETLRDPGRTSARLAGLIPALQVQAAAAAVVSTPPAPGMAS
jgi:hypothetical protein